MTPRPLCAAIAAVVLLSSSTLAQTSSRLKGTVKDEAGAPVAGTKMHAEALQGFRGEQFVGQKEFSTTANAKGERNILGLTSGMWVFEAAAANLTPEVVVLPVQYSFSTGQ